MTMKVLVGRDGRLDKLWSQKTWECVAAQTIGSG